MLWQLIAFILGVPGVTHIVVDGAIFAPIRQAAKCVKWMGQLLSCYQCVGFWVGLAAAYWLGFDNPIRLLFLAGAGSFLSVLTAATLDKLER